VLAEGGVERLYLAPGPPRSLYGTSTVNRVRCHSHTTRTFRLGTCVVRGSGLSLAAGPVPPLFSALVFPVRWGAAFGII
jgi:hypothetical protein